MTGADHSEEQSRLGRFLTVADVAEVLSISVAETFELIHTGELPAIRIGSGSHWRIEQATLSSYIDAMYEQTQRESLWNQATFANVTDLSFGPS